MIEAINTTADKRAERE